MSFQRMELPEEVGHTECLGREKAIDSVPAKMKKKLPRKGQFDLEGIYSDLLFFLLF